MLQRQIIVPSRRKKDNQFSQVDNFYGQSCFDADKFDDITSLLIKRLQLENNEEKNEEGNKVKKCCVDDEKFANDIVEIKSTLHPTAILEITAEMQSHRIHARDLRRNNKQQRKSLNLKIQALEKQTTWINSILLTKRKKQRIKKEKNRNKTYIKQFINTQQSNVVEYLQFDKLLKAHVSIIFLCAKKIPLQSTTQIFQFLFLDLILNNSTFSFQSFFFHKISFFTTQVSTIYYRYDSP